MTPQDDDARPDATEVDAAAEEPLRRLLEKLSAEHGFDFREYKLGSLSRRIDARRSHLGVDTLDTYIRHLDRHPEEAAALFDTILINVTSFFRDPEAWEALRQEVVPELIQVAAETRTIRVWCAACSSGEEAYSVRSCWRTPSATARTTSTSRSTAPTSTRMRWRRPGRRSIGWSSSRPSRRRRSKDISSATASSTGSAGTCAAGASSAGTTSRRMRRCRTSTCSSAGMS